MLNADQTEISRVSRDFSFTRVVAPEKISRPWKFDERIGHLFRGPLAAGNRGIAAAQVFSFRSRQFPFESVRTWRSASFFSRKERNDADIAFRRWIFSRRVDYRINDRNVALRPGCDLLDRIFSSRVGVVWLGVVAIE